MTELVQLGDVALVFNGKTPSRTEHREAGHPVLKIRDVSAGGQFIGVFDSFVEPTLASKYADKHLVLGDTLILNAAHNADYVGSKAYLAEPDVVGCLPTGEWLVVRAKRHRADPHYLHHWITGLATKRRLRDLVKGIHLYPRDVASLQLRLPHQSEQTRIATILNKVHSLRHKRQEAIQLADDFLKATFIELFGDPVTNSQGWPTKALKSLGTLDRGVSRHRPRNDPRLLGGDYPLIQTGDVANCDGYVRTFTTTYSEMGLRQSKLWPAGTLCITIAANIAKTGILLFPACFPDSVVGFSASDRPTVEYVRFWLSFLQQTLEANAPASAQKNINLAILRELQIPVPSRDRVERFAAAVEKVEAIRTAQRQAVDEGQKLHRALEHALLNP